jgi:hypothetical protein
LNRRISYSTVVFTVLFVLISIPPAISQPPPIDVIPENLEPSTEQTFLPEQIREFELFASNGTSFDAFIEQSEPSDNEYLNSLFVVGEYVSPIIGFCSTSELQTSYSTLCDAVASLLHELCQGTQYEVSLCTSPYIPNYINSRSLSEEQTSALAYSLLLDLVTKR